MNNFTRALLGTTSFLENTGPEFTAWITGLKIAFHIVGTIKEFLAGQSKALFKSQYKALVIVIPIE
ncbi:MAG: hypothetical protein KBS53_05320 [Bacteroidales bacterium]|nr:hypothetical protein [Candidatus Hennigimonas equi]